MEQRLSLVTLGVADLAASRRFYETGLGWQAAGVSTEHIAFFQLGGIALALYPWEKLAEDAGLEAVTTPQEKGFRGMTLAYNVHDKQAVEAVLKQAETAGATLVKPAQDVFWGGYHGYFADLDGHLWEVAWNPFAKLNDKGEFILE